MGVISYTTTSNTTEESNIAPVTDDAISGMDDGNTSNSDKGATLTASGIYSDISGTFDHLKRSYGLYGQGDYDIFNNRYRFGLFMPYETLSTTREFLFFTKPDLNIITTADGETDPNGNSCVMGALNAGLANNTYFVDLYNKHKDVISQLEYSYGDTTNPFNNLLANMCISNLSVPGLDAETVDTPTNAYGTGYSYRGSSEASNDNFEFSLEFKDNKYLPVYHFFRAYEEYETLKHHGVIAPQRKYIEDKVLHDQFAIYKFMVDEDMETIVYYAKFYGVFPKSLPRDIFSSSSFDSGVSYSIDFKAAFFDDMDPIILNDFNAISQKLYNNSTYRVDVYNDEMDRIDNRPTKAAYVTEATSEKYPGGKKYKLKWKGDDAY